ncbi:MAG: hypothetical protein KAR44_07810 [Candidatus Aegiribacteria sp.]|nr:hypothetical protein [Candidatus Aegiribacteria sp.]
MKTYYTIALTVLLNLFISPAFASIIEFKELDIDFTDSTDAAAKAAWSHPDLLKITTNGLGWDGEPASLLDGWIHTAPMALGLSWRVPCAVSVRVIIQPEIEEITLNSGQVSTPYQGDVYVRYSPDIVHWSTWQVLGQGDTQNITEDQASERTFSGTISVPYIEMIEYRELLGNYAEMDVPWKSDEDAAVRWIVENDPGFFERQIPFIGYIEFLYEGSFHGGQRITSFRAEVTYGMGGLHYAPENDDYGDRDSRTWSFCGIPE